LVFELEVWVDCRDADDFCEEHPEVVLLCTSILSTEAVLRSLPVQRLKRNTLFVDVLSVKEFPKNLFLQVILILTQEDLHLVVINSLELESNMPLCLEF